MSGIQNLCKAKATDPSFKVDGLVSKGDISDRIPADTRDMGGMQSFAAMNRKGK